MSRDGLRLSLLAHGYLDRREHEREFRVTQRRRPGHPIDAQPRLQCLRRRCGDDACYYGYDTAGRVVYEGGSAQGSSPDTFAYDSAGNVEENDGYLYGGSTDITYDDADEVTSQDGNIFTSDTIDDEASDGSRGASYGYDQAGRMTSATISGTTTHYLVNGEGLEHYDPRTGAR